MKIITFIRRHLAIVIALAVAIVMLVGIIVLMNVMTGSNQGATPDEATTVQPTTVAPTTAQPTTVQPTTAQPTTVAPTTEAEEEDDDDAFYGGVGGGDTYVDPGDNRDMNGSKDSAYHDKDNEGRHIVYGGNEGYGASTSGKKASPVPEKIFEEEHPLPDPVNPKKDFPDSKTITYEEIQSGVEPEEGDIIQLTPAN